MGRIGVLYGELHSLRPLVTYTICFWTLLSASLGIGYCFKASEGPPFVFITTDWAEISSPTSVLVLLHRFIGTVLKSFGVFNSPFGVLVITPTPIIIRSIPSGDNLNSTSSDCNTSHPKRQAGDSSARTNLPQMLLFPIVTNKGLLILIKALLIFSPVTPFHGHVSHHPPQPCGTKQGPGHAPTHPTQCIKYFPLCQHFWQWNSKLKSVVVGSWDTCSEHSLPVNFQSASECSAPSLNFLNETWKTTAVLLFLFVIWWKEQLLFTQAFVLPKFCQ